MGYQPGTLVPPPVGASGTGAVLRLVRAENCVLAGLATLVGAGTAGGAGPGPGPVALAGGVAAVVSVLAYGNVVNDLADVDGDRLGKSGRPLPSGRVTPGQASSLAAALLAAAVGVTVATNPGHLPFVAAMCLVAALYSPYLKRVPLLGNVVVAGQCGATLVFGALVAGGATSTTATGAVLVAAGMLCVEVAKTVDDHDADARVGILTVAHLVGPAGHQRLVAACSIAYLAVVLLTGAGARGALLCAMAVAPVIPLLAFALVPGGRRIAPSIMASKCLWPLVLVAIAGW